MSRDKQPPKYENPPEVPSDTPEEDVTQRDFVEGQIPGMPVSTDPLLQPMPVPAQRERRPLD